MRRLVACLLAAPCLVSTGMEAGAETGWAEEKCRRYRVAAEALLRAEGREGLGAEFLERHTAFIDGGCTGRGDVCPDTPRERAFADAMTLRAVSSGMSGTFLPFACRK